MKKDSKLRNIRKWLIVGAIAAIIIIVASALYLLLRPHSKTVAQVNGVAITQEALDQQVAFPLTQTPGIFDEQGGAANKKEVEQRNLDAAIEQQLLLQEAKNRGIKVPSKTINSTYDSLIASYPSKTALQDKLKAAGLTEKELKTKVADNLTISELTKSLVPDSSATDAKLKAYYNFHKDRYAGAGNFAELKDEIKADYLNDARSAATSKLVAGLKREADIKK